MFLQTVRFASVLFTALSLAPALAHLFELPNKIGLPRDEYVVAQKLYRGWQFVGVAVVGALLFTLLLAVLVRNDAEQFVPAVVALVSIVMTQVIFWTFTFPVNKRTVNWTRVPGDWERLRNRWEYSHAASAVCNRVALGAIAIAMIAPLS